MATVPRDMFLLVPCIHHSDLMENYPVQRKQEREIRNGMCETQWIEFHQRLVCRIPIRNGPIPTAYRVALTVLLYLIGWNGSWGTFRRGGHSSVNGMKDSVIKVDVCIQLLLLCEGICGMLCPIVSLCVPQSPSLSLRCRPADFARSSSPPFAVCCLPPFRHP